MTALSKMKGYQAVIPQLLLDSRLGSAEGGTNRSRRSSGVPVGASREDVVAAEVVARETEVVDGQRVALIDNVAEVAGDSTVEADGAARNVAQVRAEAAEAGVELLKDDGLGLNCADLLRDNALGHFLENQEALLNDLNGLAVAHELAGGSNLSRGREGSNEVVDSEEVVESREIGVATPVIEGDTAVASREISATVKGNGLRRRTTDEGSGDGDSLENLGEHFKR